MTALEGLCGAHLALNEKVLAVGADQGLGQEGGEVDHDLPEQGADGAQGHLQLLGQLRLPRDDNIKISE